MILEPVQYDITVYADRDYSKTFIIKDSVGGLIDITSWEAEAQIRPTYTSNVLIAQFVIIKDIPTATFTISLESAITGAISPTNPITLGSKTSSSNMVWDMAIDAAGERFSLITGICNFTGTVSREV
jgi:hypothetical protein